MIIYKFIFYKFERIFQFFESSSKANSFFNTLFVLCANALSISFLAELVLKKALLNKISDFILIIAVGVYLYYSTLYKNQYLTFKERFATEVPWKRAMGNAFALIYCVGSFLILGYLYDKHLALL